MTLIVDFIVLITLAIVGLVDRKSYRIPNKLVLFIMAAGITKILFFDGEIINILYSVIIAGLFLALGIMMSRVKKTQSLGLGDVKLITGLTLVFGLYESVSAIWLSSLVALISFYILKTRHMNNKIPFGFYLSIGYIIVFTVSLFLF